MKNKIVVLILFVLGTFNLYAQQQDSILLQEILGLKNEFVQQKAEIDQLKSKLKKQERLLSSQRKSVVSLKTISEQLTHSLNNLKKQVTVNNKNIITNSEKLGTEIQKVASSTDSKISELDKSVDNNRLYWIIASLIILVLGGVMYFFLGKRIKLSKNDVESQLKNTRLSLDEESLKLDTKLIEILEKQIKIAEENAIHTPGETSELDHSLALKVADEIVKMQKNLSRMDPKTKGLKQLTRSIKSISNNFAANGYEIVEMLGKEYNEGMKVLANIIPSEDIESGNEIITRIIKPQVNFNGEMIQSAQVEVSVGQ